MTLTTVDGSTAISESRKVRIASRDGAVCILYGMDPIDVAHIVARKSGNQARVVSDSRKWLNLMHKLVGWLDSHGAFVVQFQGR